MEKVKLSLLQVNALVHAVNSFPENTPKRWSLVSELVSVVSHVEDGGNPPFIEVEINLRHAGILL